MRTHKYTEKIKSIDSFIELVAFLHFFNVGQANNFPFYVKQLIFFQKNSTWQFYSIWEVKIKKKKTISNSIFP